MFIHNPIGLLQDDFQSDEFPVAFDSIHQSPSPVISNKSIRISATPSPSKKKEQKSPNNRKSLKTPEASPRKDKDPLRKLKIDETIRGFLSDVAKQPAVKKIAKVSNISY